MKKSRRFLSVLCAVCMIFAMSVSASATTLGNPTYHLDPNYQPERYAGEMPAAVARALRALTPDQDCFMPHQNYDGDNGEVLFAFQTDSDDTTVKWRVDWNQSGVNDVYYYQLWRVNGGTIKDSKIGAQKQASFGGVPSYDNLQPNTQYYIKVSSRDVPTDGANCLFAYEVF